MSQLLDLVTEEKLDVYQPPLYRNPSGMLQWVIVGAHGNEHCLRLLSDNLLRNRRRTIVLSTDGHG